jgi:hypothetical protein
MQIGAHMIVEREIGDEVEQYDVYLTGNFYHGELEDWDFDSDVEIRLSEKEIFQAHEILCENYADRLGN